MHIHPGERKPESRWTITAILLVLWSSCALSARAQEAPPVGSSVLFDEEMGFYRMWYEVWAADHENQILCYATSPDGIAWRKPVTSPALPWRPLKEHDNIVFGGTPGFGGARVAKDPNEPDAEHRYKMLYRDQTDGTERSPSSRVACSPDGILWKPCEVHSSIPVSEPRKDRDGRAATEKAMFIPRGSDSADWDGGGIQPLQAPVVVGDEIRIDEQEGTLTTMPQVLVSHYLAPGDGSSALRSADASDTVAVAAAPGEYEPATITIRAGKALQNVSVKVAGALENDGGGVLPTAAVEIRLLDSAAEWSQGSRECYLLKKSTVDIDANASRRFWTTVHVPDDAAPGTYHSTLLITHTVTELGPDLGRRVTLASLDYEVEVRPIRLLSARETGMAFFMYNDTAYYSEDMITPDYQGRVFEDMREHGMTTATVYVYPVVDGTFSAVASGSPRHLGFSTTMDRLKAAGLVAPNVPVIWIGAEAYGPEVWREALEERARRDWPRILFYAADEPGEEARNVQVRAFMKKLAAFRGAHPEYGVRVTTALGSSRGIQTVGHHYDVWISHMMIRPSASAFIADARMYGKELWTYDCTLAPVDPEMNRYHFGLWAWVSGVKGCALWAYFDGNPKLSYVYPTADDLVPTIGWEGVREGVDDYRYLATLRKLADRARAMGKPELAADADRIFQQVDEMVHVNRYAEAWHEVIEAATEATRWEVSTYDRPRPEPNLDIEAWDRMRSRVAKAIADLAAALPSSGNMW